ncbi:hypothetical protein THAOC_27860 [Thalassiosira oceanica]|uniref:Uncharacterized protein n=1 Tax=Thalassiosira oceanica TaxID=159749 RepID=K0RVG6_THAOC|nr:hypothetical protein THAOC_27860 [Thalassiosira oceanica]|eukprot:EJK52831.1 hypothetical protein THAOC_27860 [Thalassiosira oceanica]
MEKSSVGYRGFSSTVPSPVDHKACGDVLSLSHLQTASVGLESHHRKHNPYDHQSATVPDERWDKIEDVDRGTADEVHPTDYAARQSIPAIRISIVGPDLGGLPPKRMIALPFAVESGNRSGKWKRRKKQDRDDMSLAEEQHQPPQPPAPAVPAVGPLPDAVTAEELMNSGHELPEGYTCPLCCLPIALPAGEALQVQVLLHEDGLLWL